MRSFEGRELCAFVRIGGDGDEVLGRHGCRPLARFGDIYIAAVPLSAIEVLARESQVSRIEARQANTISMDTTVIVTHAAEAHRGQAVQHPYTGQGVVMGIQDIGFDLTHPNFYDAQASEYRIKRFWDQLSTDTLGSTLFVGADYTTRQDILAYARSRDGLDQTHGTHTLGIAAGAGYGSVYRGVAFESDICLVSNAVTDDLKYIDEKDLYKYTSATDALGFKYIFDYAESVGKPCVISFSEGSHPDLWGDDRLYYEVLGQLMGPGRIIVASAGNEGHFQTYLRKPPGEDRRGGFIYNQASYVFFRMQGDKPFSMCVTSYDTESGGSESFSIDTGEVCLCADSTFVDTLVLHGVAYAVEIVAGPSCYYPGKTAYEVYLEAVANFGGARPVSVELVGREADAELFTSAGRLFSYPEVNPLIAGGESRYSIHSPAEAPSVICVGSTGYRRGNTNYKGVWKESDWGIDGVRSGYSGVGPAMDGRCKPDVMAPGTNVIASYSSYYCQEHPDANDVDWNVAEFMFNGRKYFWNSNTGTSMASPVVGGVVALWLQADPTLTPERVRGVIARTSRRYDPGLQYPNCLYGYGEINAYGGLMDILGLSHIEGMPLNNPQHVEASMQADGTLCLTAVGSEIEATLTLYIYDVSGRKVMQRDVPMTNGHARLSLTHLPRGVYAVRIGARSEGLNGSVLVRR